MKKLIFFFCLMILSAGAFAQPKNNNDGVELLRTAIQNFLGAQELSFEYVLTSRCYAADKKPIVKSYKGSYQRRGESFILTYQDITTVNTGGYLLNISKSEKTIIIQKSKKEVDTEFLFTTLDSSKYMIKDSVQVAKDSSKKIFFKPRPGSELDYVTGSELLLDPTGWIKKITVNYDTNQQTDFDEKCSSLEVSYQLQTLSVPDNKKFSLSQYVKIDGDKVSPSGSYAGYQVISSLSYEQEHD